MKNGISDWYIPADADAVALTILQTSSVIVYTLYDSSWSEDVSTRTALLYNGHWNNIVQYSDIFSLVSVNLKLIGFETRVATVGTVW